MHTLQLEEYGVSKKCVIIMDKRQDSNAASTPPETDLRLRIVTVPEVQEEVQRIDVETEKNRDKSRNCDVYVTWDDVRCF